METPVLKPHEVAQEVIEKMVMVTKGFAWLANWAKNCDYREIEAEMNEFQTLFANKVAQFQAKKNSLFL